MINKILLSLLILFNFSIGLMCQENFENIGLSLSQSFSAADFATRIDLTKVINQHELQIGTHFTRVEDYDKKGIKGFHLGYRFYPNDYKSLNLNFFIDNKIIPYKTDAIPTNEKASYQIIFDQIVSVTLLESLIGVGFDIKFLERFKFFGDFGMGYMWEWYKYSGYPENPRKINDISAQLRIGFIGYLHKYKINEP